MSVCVCAYIGGEIALTNTANTVLIGISAMTKPPIVSSLILEKKTYREFMRFTIGFTTFMSNPN